MTKKIKRRIASLLLILQINLSFFLPLSPFIQTSWAVAEAGLEFSYNSGSNSLVVAAEHELDYKYFYANDGILEGNEGKLSTGDNALYIGTQSDDDFVAYDFDHLVFKTASKAYFLEKENNQVEIEKTSEVESLELGDSEEEWLIWNTDQDAKTAVTRDVVKQDKTYVFPLNNKVKVAFTKLPEETSALTIKEVKLSAELVEKFGVDVAYDITTEMKNGSFEFDLELPKPENAEDEDVEIVYAKDENELEQNSQKVEAEIEMDQEEKTVKLKQVKHMTVFVVAPAVPPTNLKMIIDNSHSAQYHENGTDWRNSVCNVGYEDDETRVRDPKEPYDAYSAEWHFEVPETDNYQVLASWSSHSNRTQSSVYEVYEDGNATPLAISTPVDQTGSNCAYVDFTEVINSVNLTAGVSYTVQVVNQGSGYLIADAVSLVPQSQPMTVYVDDNWTGSYGNEVDGKIIGWNAFATINEAVEQVQAGGTVQVAEGVYSEVVSIEDSANLSCQDGAVLDGSGLSDQDVAAITVAADDVKIDGCEIRGYQKGIITVDPLNTDTGVKNLVITNNYIHDLYQWNADGLQTRRSNGIHIGAESENFRPYYVGNRQWTGQAVTNQWDYSGLDIRGNNIEQSYAGVVLVGTKSSSPSNLLNVEDNTIDNAYQTAVTLNASRDVKIFENRLVNNYGTGLYLCSANEAVWQSSYEVLTNDSMSPRNIEISDNQINNNGQKYYSYSSDASSDASIERKLNNGIALVSAWPSEIIINNNQITDNNSVNPRGIESYGIRNFTDEDVDATNNWWGAVDGPAGEGTGSGDKVSTNVSFCPWLNAADGGSVGPCLGEIQGRKYLDLNQNSWMDNDEYAGLSGWEIKLYDNNWNYLSAVETGDSTGLWNTVNADQYRFENLQPGTYHVCETQQADYLQTGPALGDNPRNPSGDVVHTNAVAVENSSTAGSEGEVCWEVEVDDERVGYLKFGNYETKCGNGEVEPGEECDYGELNQFSTCSAQCTWVTGTCNEEMAANGEFEMPAVKRDQWDVFASSDIPGWDVSWVEDVTEYEGDRRPEPRVEIHAGVNGWTTADDQYVELDGDWQGPRGNVHGEPASVSLSQTIPTTVGYKYIVSWDYAARPNHDDNHLQVSINGAEVFNSGSIAGVSDVAWQSENREFIADQELTTVTFTEIGKGDSLGMFLDNVQVECRPTAEVKVCKVDQNQQALPGWTMILKKETAEERVEVAPDGGVYQSSDLPEDDYILTASGTYEYRGNSGLLTDPGYSERYESDGYSGPYEPWINVMDLNGALGIKVNSNSTDWGEYTDTHSYSLAYPAYSAGVFNFSVYDNQYADNVNNTMAVEIYQGQFGVTDADGCHTFENVEYGDYIVEEKNQQNWQPLTGLSQDLTVDGPQEQVEFVNEYVVKGSLNIKKYICARSEEINDTTFSVDGAVYHESDIRPTAEGLVNGIAFSDLDNDSFAGCYLQEDVDFAVDYHPQDELGHGQPTGSVETVGEFTTDANGEIVLSDLDVSGRYEVREQLVEDQILGFACYRAGTGHGNITNEGEYALMNGENQAYCIAFNREQTGDIAGFKYEDVNANAQHDDEETKLPDWTIELFDNQGQLVATKVTGERGGYSFTDLTPGDYQVCEINQKGWYSTKPGNAKYCQNVTVIAEEEQNVNFGNKQIPVYDGDHVCPDGTEEQYLATLTLDSQSQNPVNYAFAAETPYLLKAHGTYQYANNSQRLADPAYGTVDGFANTRDDIGIWGTNRGVTSILGDFGQGMGIIEWDDDYEVNENNEYQKLVQFTEDFSAQFVISDWYDSWYTANRNCNNQSCMHDNSGELEVDVYECVEKQTTEVKICKEDPEGNPLADWLMTLTAQFPETDTAPIQYQGVTDEDGCLTFSEVELGDYLLTEGSRNYWTRLISDPDDTVPEDGLISITQDIKQEYTFVNQYDRPDVLVCKEDEQGQRLAGWEMTLASEEQSIQTMPLPVDGTVVSTTELSPGDYLVKASGTYDYGPGLADAAYSYRWGLNPASVSCGATATEPWVNMENPADPACSYPDYLNIRLSTQADMSNFSTSWGKNYSETHEYQQQVSLTNPGKFYLAILDNYYADNIDNTLQVEIIKLGEKRTGITQNSEDEFNGCVVIEDVDFGNYLLTETLQTGWQQQSLTDNNAQEIILNSLISVNEMDESFTFVNEYDDSQEEPTESPTPTPIPTQIEEDDQEAGLTADGGEDGTGDGGGDTSPATYSCDAAKPGVVNNFAVAASTANSVTLTWTHADGVNASDGGYGLFFTNTRTGQIYGAANIGYTNTYTINGISGGDTYEFRIFAINDCMPGDESTLSTPVTGPALTTRPEGPEGEVLGVEDEEGEGEGQQQEDGMTEQERKAAVKGAQDNACSNFKINILWILLVIQLIAVLGVDYKYKTDDSKKKHFIAAGTTVLSIIAFYIFSDCDCYGDTSLPALLCRWYWLVSMVETGLAKLFSYGFIETVEKK